MTRHVEFSAPIISKDSVCLRTHEVPVVTRGFDDGDLAGPNHFARVGRVYVRRRDSVGAPAAL